MNTDEAKNPLAKVAAAKEERWQIDDLYPAEYIAGIFGITEPEVEKLRKKKIITGIGNPKKYDLLPTIMAYIRYLQGETQYDTAAELADLFGFEGTRRIEQLKADGVIMGTGKPTKYNHRETVKTYVKFLSEKAYGREKKETDAQLMTDKLDAEKRIKTAKAEMAEIELKELKGKMHSAEDVEDIMTDHVFFLRSMLMAMPGKLAVDLAGSHTAAEQADRVRQEVYYILENLAGYKYDPEEYKKRVMDRKGWENSHVADGKDGDIDDD